MVLPNWCLWEFVWFVVKFCICYICFLVALEKIVIIQHIRRHISLTIESKYISVKFCLFINQFYLDFWKEENYLDYKKNWTIVKTKLHIWREETLRYDKFNSQEDVWTCNWYGSRVKGTWMEFYVIIFYIIHFTHW